MKNRSTKPIKPAPAAQPTPASTPQPVADDENFMPDDVALMECLASLDDSSPATVRIYRQGNTGRDLTLLNECTPAEFTPMMLAHAPYLGGNFRIHIQNNGIMIRNMPLKVQRAAGAVALPESAQASNMPPDVLSIVRELSSGFERSIEKLAAAMQPKEPNPLQSLDGLKQLAEIVRAPAAVVAPGNDFNSMLKSFETFNNLIDKMKPEPPIVREDGDISLPALALTFMRELANARNPQSAAAPALPKPNPPAGADNQEAEEMKIVIKYQLREANKAAAQDVDAKDFAEAIYPIIPAGLIQMMGTEPDWFKGICELVPECAQYQTWYMKAAETIRGMAVEDGLLKAPPAAGSPLQPDPQNATVAANGNLESGVLPAAH